jgi:hypothetical protein
MLRMVINSRENFEPNFTTLFQLMLLPTNFTTQFQLMLLPTNSPVLIAIVKLSDLKKGKVKRRYEVKLLASSGRRRVVWSIRHRVVEKMKSYAMFILHYQATEKGN